MTDIKLPFVVPSEHPEFPVLAWSPLEIAAINRLMLEAVRLNAQTEPDGWKLVPVEPTPEMLDAANLARKYREHGALTDPDVLNSRTYNSRQTYTAMLSAAPAAPQPAQHPDDEAVDRFAEAMKQKLAQAREKGRGGWETCPPEELSRMLREHVEKGDPRDVANFCMFLWSLGHGITAKPAPAAPAAPQQRSVSAMQKAIEALKMVEPYSDQLTCYTSTAAEWPLNNLPAMVSVAINELQDSLNAAPAAPQPAPTPRKIEIPPPGADALDVAFAEGWNQCCDAYFGGLPPQAPLVVTVFKTNSDTAEAAPQPAQPNSVALAVIGCKHFGNPIPPEWYAAAKELLSAAAQQPLTDEKDALLRQALEALEGFTNITNDSQGIKGYHLNGDIAEWDEFDEVGAASSAIEAIRNHLGVEP